MATKVFILILQVTGDHSINASCELDKIVKSFLDAATRPWEMHALYNPDGIVKYSVIHRLWLINSAQLCNKKFQSIC